MTQRPMTAQPRKELDFYFSEENRYQRWCDKLSYEEVEIANYYWTKGYSLDECKDQVSIYRSTIESVSEIDYALF